MTFIKQKDENNQCIHIQSDNKTAKCGMVCEYWIVVSKEELQKTTRNCCRCWQQVLKENRD